MGSYPRCAPRSGRCGWGQGVVCVRVCLAEASVGLIGGCVRSCRLGGARRHPPPRAHGGSCRWLGLLCRAKRLLTRRLGVCSQVAIRARRSGVLVRWRVGCVWCCRCVSVCVGLTHRCARRRKPAWWCSPPLPAPGSWGVVVGLALPRGAASDSAAWCACSLALAVLWAEAGGGGRHLPPILFNCCWVCRGGQIGVLRARSDPRVRAAQAKRWTRGRSMAGGRRSVAAPLPCTPASLAPHPPLSVGVQISCS